MRALITGAGGFVGGHLCAYLLAHTDWELTGTVYPRPVEARPLESRLRLVHADLRDPEAVHTLVGEVQPGQEVIYTFHITRNSGTGNEVRDLGLQIRGISFFRTGGRRAGLKAGRAGGHRGGIVDATEKSSSPPRR